LWICKDLTEIEYNDKNSLIQMVNDYYEKYKELYITMYKIEDLTEEEMETYIPINGGQYWIEGISHIDF
jgi:hypothetical protein